ncbi:MAG: hypothetical protein K2Q14_01410, partial [Gammaproteobacteria bacterium]|nr:hypothetical protein [Gammaproteobacteria bacterium]
KRMTNNASPDVITLQEITADKGLLKEILAVIGDQYEVTMEVDKYNAGKEKVADAGANITLVRKNKFSANNYARGTHYGTIDSWQNHLTLKSGEKLCIRNVHAAFQHTPLKHEKSILSFLFQNRKKAEVTDDTTNVTIGDFNAAVSSAPGTPLEYSATSVAPGGFTPEYPIQHGHKIDAAFAYHPHTQTTQQARTIQYNPQTGLPFTAAEIARPPESMPDQQRDIFYRFRPAMHIDHIYAPQPFDDICTNSILPGEISQLDDDFNKKNTLNLRYATDLFNHPGLSAFGPYGNEQLPHEWLQTWENYRNLFPEFQYVTHNDNTKLMNASKDQSLAFIKALNAYELLLKFSSEVFQTDALKKLVQAVVWNADISFKESEVIFDWILSKSHNCLTSFIDNMIVSDDSNESLRYVEEQDFDKLFKGVKALTLFVKVSEQNDETGTIENKTLKSDNEWVNNHVNKLIKTVVDGSDFTVKEAGVIFKHFHEPVDAIIQDRQPDMEILEKTKTDLDKEVHYNSHWSTQTKKNIGTAAGVIVGGSIFIGTLVTIGVLTGGIGTLPFLTGTLLVILGIAAPVGSAKIGRDVGEMSAYKGKTVKPTLSGQYQKTFNSAATAVFTTLFKPKKAERLKQEENNPNSHTSLFDK